MSQETIRKLAQEQGKIKKVITTYKVSEKVKKTLKEKDEYVMEMTSAAHYLNISLAYLTQLLDKHEIPYIESMGQRLIKHQDILTYEKKRDEHRRKSIGDLISYCEELELYDIE